MPPLPAAAGHAMHTLVCVLPLLRINGGACVSRVAARLLALATEWVDIRQHPGTSAYCLFSLLEMVGGIRGYWAFSPVLAIG